MPLLSPWLQSIERVQRTKAQGLKNLDDFEPNDLNYEGRLLEDRFLYDGISFNLATETGEDAGGFGPFAKRLSGSAWFQVRVSQTRGVPSALSKSLDDAFALWKQLLATPGVPAVRSPEQTVASLQLLAALYKLAAKVTLAGRWPAGRQPPQAHRVPLRWSLSVTVGFFLPPAIASHGELPPGQSPVRHTRGQPGHGRRPVPGHQAALPAGVPQLCPGKSGREGRAREVSWADPRGCSPHAGPLVSSFSWRRRSPACRKPPAATIPTCCCSKPASCSAASCAASTAG